MALKRRKIIAIIETKVEVHGTHVHNMCGYEQLKEFVHCMILNGIECTVIPVTDTLYLEVDGSVSVG